MIRITAALACILFLGYPIPGFTETKPLGQVEISFNFNRIARDYANNQFAVWIEDVDGKLIKTLYATRFTARGGWKYRSESLPEWSGKSGIAHLSRQAVDAVSGATPKASRLTYTWKGDNAMGDFLPAGKYRYCVEANFYWDEMVVNKGVIHLGGHQARNQATATYSSTNAEKNPIIENVSALYIPF